MSSEIRECENVRGIFLRNNPFKVEDLLRNLPDLHIITMIVRVLTLISSHFISISLFYSYYFFLTHHLQSRNSFASFTSFSILNAIFSHIETEYLKNYYVIEY